MVDETELQRSRHSAVYLDNCVIIIGGSREDYTPLPTNVIWMYNLHTEEWRNHVIPKHVIEETGAPGPFFCSVAVAIHGVVYTFGGLNNCDLRERNALWTLNETNLECFTWNFIKVQHAKESPSPRYGHTGWEYAGKLWVFGGKGDSPKHYLNNNGDIAVDFVARNNQLLCYDPSIQRWTNPQCFGAVPSPRSDHASTIVNDKVWLFGGHSDFLTPNGDIFELTMPSLTWAQIQTGQPGPQARICCTLTAVTGNQLVLHGGGHGHYGFLGDTWIMDLTTHSWIQYTSRKDHLRSYHSGSVGLNNNVIIIGGERERYDTCESHDIFHVMLEAKSLQQLATQTIYKHQVELNWNYLPEKLISLLGITKQKRQMPSRRPGIDKQNKKSTPLEQTDFDDHSKTLKSDEMKLSKITLASNFLMRYTHDNDKNRRGSCSRLVCLRVAIFMILTLLLLIGWFVSYMV